MQGKLIIAATLVALFPSATLAAETVRRQGCKIEQQQRQQQQNQSQQQPQQRMRVQDCRLQKPIPPVVDPTPWFVL